ncbi:MAG: hypothetical protein JWN06_2763 [Propionibacteriaceae bacterium]|nr:hypothetical protein [Propionibacteriaceae bacterium]
MCHSDGSATKHVRDKAALQAEDMRWVSRTRIAGGNSTRVAPPRIRGKSCDAWSRVQPDLMRLDVNRLAGCTGQRHLDPATSNGERS